MKGLLIANRDNAAREHLAGMFPQDEYRVTTADSVAEALEGIINKEIQVVVLDGSCHEENVVVWSHCSRSAIATSSLSWFPKRCPLTWSGAFARKAFFTML